MDAQKLKLLADSIHDNCTAPDTRRHVAAIAEHMKTFWSPLMINELAAAERQGEISLPAATIAALERLNG